MSVLELLDRTLDALAITLMVLIIFAVLILALVSTLFSIKWVLNLL